MSLADDFQAAIDRVNARATAPSQGDQLKLYGLYKQSSQGDNTAKRPGMTKVRERAKHDAWATNKGMSKDDAMSAYIKLADSLG